MSGTSDVRMASGGVNVSRGLPDRGGGSPSGRVSVGEAQRSAAAVSAQAATDAALREREERQRSDTKATKRATELRRIAEARIRPWSTGP